MKASELFAGEHYAWKSSPPKGRIPTNAKKVRLRYIEQRKKSYMQNKSTVAAITEVETGMERTVPARELIMFWDEYEGERDHLLAEQREHEMHRRRSQLRRTVIETIMNSRLQEKGIPIVVAYHGDTNISINNSSSMRSWLDIEEEEITLAIDRQMEVEYGEKENGALAS